MEGINFPKPETTSSPSIEKNKPESVFEKKERPKYRYFYHGTFSLLAEKIQEKGFKSKEYYPNLTLSPIEGFRFLERIMEKGGNSMKTRGRHLTPAEQVEFKPEEIKTEDSVILVIEPPVEYKVQSTNEGRPNVFSSPDQIPDDIDETIRTRIWDKHQHAMSKEPISSKNKGTLKFPGINANYRMLPNGERVRLEKEKQITTPFKLPESSVKMIIKKEPEFLKIFQEMEEKVNDGKHLDLISYKKRLVDYFKNGQGFVKREPLDEEELAENMVMGELEHLIVTTIRILYLDLERYRGKKFISWITNEEENRPVKTKEDILNKINKLRLIAPENDIFRRYIEICTNRIEKELMDL